MNFFGMPLIPKDISIFNIFTSITPILITLYGLYIFWPRFIKQKRIENLSSNAKETLKIVTSLESSFHEFLLVSTNAERLEEKVVAAKKTEVTLIILKTFNSLRNALLLIRHDPNLKTIKDVHNLIIWVEKLSETSKELYEQKGTPFSVDNFFSRIDPQWLENKHISIDPLEKLRTILLSIYEFRAP